jgi:hypothetical protein
MVTLAVYCGGVKKVMKAPIPNAATNTPTTRRRRFSSIFK